MNHFPRPSLTDGPGGQWIGLDLGTTNGYVAVLSEGGPRVLVDRDGQRELPLVLASSPEGKLLLGHQARLFAATGEPALSGLQRLIGRRWDPEAIQRIASRLPFPLEQGPAGRIRIPYGGRHWSAEAGLGLLLGQLRQRAETYLGERVERAAIAVPQYFTAEQRAGVEEVARLAGLAEVRLLDAPQAVAFALGRQHTGTLAIVHLGGATIDCSVLSRGSVVSETLGYGADSFLGGDDFDGRLLSLLLNHTPLRGYPAFLHDAVGLGRLSEAAERAKVTLSAADRAEVDLPHLVREGESSFHLRVVVRREQLDAAVADLLASVLDLCRATLAHCQLQPGQIDALVLEGGMSRMPRLQQALAELFERDPLVGDCPEETVALGAVLAALEEHAGSDQALDLVQDPFAPMG